MYIENTTGGDSSQLDVALDVASHSSPWVLVTLRDGHLRADGEGLGT